MCFYINVVAYVYSVLTMRDVVKVTVKEEEDMTYQDERCESCVKVAIGRLTIRRDRNERRNNLQNCVNC